MAEPKPRNMYYSLPESEAALVEDYCRIRGRSVTGQSRRIMIPLWNFWLRVAGLIGPGERIGDIGEDDMFLPVPITERGLATLIALARSQSRPPILQAQILFEAALAEAAKNAGVSATTELHVPLNLSALIGD